MTPADLIRDMNARSAAVRTYARAFDEWAQEQQSLVGEGKVTEAAGAGAYASWALRAYRSEIDDPEPKPAECYHEGAAE